jgi:CheY-like chemotaxis protein
MPSASQAQEATGQSSQNPTPASQHRPAHAKQAGKPGPKRQFKSKPAARKGMAEVNGNGHTHGGKRVLRGVVNRQTPDAGVYSAPMDHSYRSLQQEGNTGQQGYTAMRVGDSATSRPIVAFIDDLFFMAKVQETARKLNVKVNFVKSDKDVLHLAGEEKPALIIIDLNHHTVKPLVVIPKLKAKFKKETNIIGFLSHLQGELKVKAQEAGCDMVLPRSAFSQNLPQLLRRHATNEAELQEY